MKANRTTAWMRLLRAAAIPSSASNVLVGYWAIGERLVITTELILLVMASISLYAFGMVTNDLFDYRSDLEERRPRPLVLHQIERKHATWVALALVVLGIGLSAAVSVVSLSVAVVLTIAILSYNGLVKNTPLGPLVMGACRGLNILLGASHLAVCPAIQATADSTAPTASPILPGADWMTGLDGTALVSAWQGVVLPIGLAYLITIAGLTWLARHERAGASRWSILTAGLVLWGGIAGFARVATGPVPDSLIGDRFPVLIALLAVPLVLRWARALFAPSAGHIRTLVVAVLSSLLFFDAALVVLVTGQTAAAIPFAALLFLQWTLRRWSSPTD